MQNTA